MYRLYWQHLIEASQELCEVRREEILSIFTLQMSELELR